MKAVDSSALFENKIENDSIPPRVDIVYRRPCHKDNSNLRICKFLRWIIREFERRRNLQVCEESLTKPMIGEIRDNREIRHNHVNPFTSGRQQLQNYE